MNKTIVITGGTSGLGQALAIQHYEAGARVAILARNAELIEAMIQRYPGMIGLPFDISKKEDIYPAAGEIHARLGDVDRLFNVASQLGPTPLRLLMDTECEDFEAVLQTNLLGPFRFTKALLPAMLLRESGVVVNISSDAAVQAYPRWGAYAVSKAALDHLTRIFQAELESQGLRFYAIDPGDMRTPMHFAAIPDADPAQLRDPHDVARRIMQLIDTNEFRQVRTSV
ncbi:MAG TPA: SDR family oxidoreductase [Oligoflexus sp.]|uniref:SDR family NAD(P)-dependent oxidoreductase n=1 Tax=Oligoflexus sp. TaxID=1971216 RepID=UPI002D4DE383|nr:SDR family oxidoreductase [Oligoflexus sp.]HYX33184.1 SDR family oxidoreductase [Oligoflexus sp.]